MYRLVFVLFVLFVQAKRPSVVSSVFQVKEGKLFDKTVTTATLDVNFDDDIYFIEGEPWCSSKCAEQSERTYQEYLTLLEEVSKINAFEFLSAIKLQPNTPYTEFISKRDAYFSFDVDDPCKYVHGQLTVSSGDADVYGYSPQNARQIKRFSYYRVGGEEFSICPEDTGFATGTFYFRIFSYDSPNLGSGFGSNFTIVLKTVDPPKTVIRDLPSKEGCNNTSTFRCVRDGDVIRTTERQLNMKIILPKATNSGIECQPLPIMLHAWTDEQRNCEIRVYSEEDPAFKVYSSSAMWYEIIVFSVCLDPLKEIQLSVIASNWYYVNMSFIFTTQAYFRLRLFSEFDPFAFKEDTYQRTSRVLCAEAKSFECFRTFFGFDSQSDCYRYSAVYPNKDPNPFWPRPLFTNGDRAFERIDFSETRNPDPKKFSAFILLALNNQLFDHPSLIATCEMKFNGMLTNANYEPVVATVKSFTQQQPVCRFDEFKSFIKQMRKLIELFQEEEPVYAQTLAYRVDSMAYSNTFIGCRDFAHSLLQEKYVLKNVPNTTLCFHSFGSIPWLNDPCCNRDISWKGECCFARDVETNKTIYSSNKTSLQEYCNSPDCTKTFLQDYFLEVPKLTYDQVDACPLINILDIEEEVKQAYKACRKKYFGENFVYGIYCNVDSDCPSGKCNLLTLQCVYERTSLSRRFLECFVENGSSVVLNFLRNHYSIPYNFNDPEFVAELYTKLLQPQCTTRFDGDAYGLFDCEPYWYLFQNCEHVCRPFLAFDPFQDVAPDCIVKLNASCERFWHASSRSNIFDAFSCSNCQYNIPVCNWFECRGSTAEECEKQCLNTTRGEYFCGLCEGTSPCIEIPDLDSEQSCNSIIACLYNQTYILTTEEECKKLQYCSRSCFNESGHPRQCTSEAECLEKGGYCSTQNMRKPLSGYGNSSCLLPLQSSFFTSDCNSTQTTTPIGCVEREESYDESYCESNGGRTVTEPTTREQCEEDLGIGCLRNVLDNNLFNSQLLTFQPSETCQRCGGNVEPFFKWTPGRWIVGVPRKLQWKKREFLGKKYGWQPAFSFQQFANDITTAIYYRNLLNLRSQIQCRYNRLLGLLEEISCDCTTELDEEQCTSSYEQSINVGTNTICGDAQTTFKATSILLTFPKGVVDRYKPCVNLSLSVISSQEFEAEQTGSLSSFLIRAQETDEYAFLNENSAIVGKIIGDGSHIKIEDGHQTIKNMVLCVIPRSDNYDSDDLKEFPIYDFATKENDDYDDRELTPIECASYKNADYICCSISEPEELPYFLVVRLKDWDEEKLFSIAERVLMYIAACLYAINFLIAIFEICEALFYRIIWKLNHHQIWIYGVLNLVRSIYFFLLVNGVITTASEVLEIILVEAPSFFYFTAFSLAVLIWVSLNKKYKHLGSSDPRRRTQISFVVVNLCLYAMFVILVILYQVFEDPDPTCAGRIPDDTFFTDRRIVAIIYRASIAAVSLIIGIRFLISGTILYYHLGKTDSMTTKRRFLNRKTTIFLIMIICATGLIFQSVFLVVIVAGDFQDNIATIIYLIFVEVVPIFLILLILHPAREQDVGIYSTTKRTHTPTASSPSSAF